MTFDTRGSIFAARPIVLPPATNGTSERDDLNRLALEDHCWDPRTGLHDGPPVPLVDPGAALGEVTVVLRDQIEHLIAFTTAAPVIVGCVAWLTHERVLAALAKKLAVSIVVQKEDFLRPDGREPSGLQRGRLWRDYTRLRFPFERYHLDGLDHLSTFGDPTIEPVRCLGNAQARSGARALMHHKFLVACDFPAGDPDVDAPWGFRPRAVWTGSLNPTRNGERSLENAVVIRREDVAACYYAEWAQVLARSEPLDWHATYAAPEWRVGT